MSSRNPADFARDETVRVACLGQETCVSERLFSRLVLLGAAYELHLLPLLREDASINAVQAETLSEELAFVRALVADEALGSLLERMTPLVTLAYRSGSEIAFEWP